MSTNNTQTLSAESLFEGLVQSVSILHDFMGLNKKVLPLFERLYSTEEQFCYAIQRVLEIDISSEVSFSELEKALRRKAIKNESFIALWILGELGQWRELKHIDSLDFSGRDLSFGIGNHLAEEFFFPANVGNLRHVKTIQFSYCRLNYLPANLSAFSQLENLDLSRNYFFYMPEEIIALRNLVYLNLADNELHSTPSCWKRNIQKAIPESITTLEHLEVLDLRRNNLFSFPNFSEEFSSLRELDLSYNKIISFPEDIKNLKGIEILALQGNNLGELPANLLEILPNLKVLDLTQNKMLPANYIFENLKDCTVDADGCLSFPCNVICFDKPEEFSSILDRVFFNPRFDSSAVKHIDLSGYGLQTLPKRIRRFKNLETIDLSENDFSVVPDVLVHFSRLRRIDLRENDYELDSIPFFLLKELPNCEVLLS